MYLSHWFLVSVFIIHYEMPPFLMIVVPLKKNHYGKGPSDDKNVKDAPFSSFF